MKDMTYEKTCTLDIYIYYLATAAAVIYIYIYSPTTSTELGPVRCFRSQTWCGTSLPLVDFSRASERAEPGLPQRSRASGWTDWI